MLSLSFYYLMCRVMLGRLIVDHLGPFWIAWVLVGERAGQWYGVAFFPSFFLFRPRVDGTF